MDNFKRFNNQPWSSFVEAFEVNPKQMKQIIPIGQSIAFQRKSSSSSSVATK